MAMENGSGSADPPARRMQKDRLMALFRAGLARVTPERCLPPHLPETPPGGRTLVLGVGKAAAAMARVAAARLEGPVSGLVAVRYGHAGSPLPPELDVIEAGHPVPDEASRRAATRMLDLASALTPADRLIFLASGGGSATASLPVTGLKFALKQALVRHLLRSGADIHAINCLRAHLSAFKGGRLAAAAGTDDILTLAMSDVTGDDPAVIASGPTVPDPTTLAEACAVIDRFGAPERETLSRLLSDPANETPKQSRPGSQFVLAASARDCLDAAARDAREAGLQVIDLGGDLTGEARALGQAHGRLARRVLGDAPPPTVILSGGETTVTIEGEAGSGGPNREYLLGLAETLDGVEGVCAIACDTDGIDGEGEVAGGFLLPDTLARARAGGVCPGRAATRHDCAAVFSAAGDHIVTGPTHSNVNDFRAILVDPVLAGGAGSG